MTVTEVRINKIGEPKSSTVAFASVTFDNALVVRDFKVVSGANGRFVAFPSRKLEKPYTNKEGKKIEYQDVAFSLDKELREEIQAKVLEEYERV